MVVLMVGLVGLGVYRWATRSKAPDSSDEFVTSTSNDSTTGAVNKLNFEIAAENTVPRTTAKLLEQLRSIDWFQFEKLVALSCRTLGYRVTRRGGANPDGGIDLVIEKDGPHYAVQCRHWKTWNVGVHRSNLNTVTFAGIPPPRGGMSVFNPAG
jgi:restriction endonuclease Mrr